MGLRASVYSSNLETFLSFLLLSFFATSLASTFSQARTELPAGEPFFGVSYNNTLSAVGINAVGGGYFFPIVNSTGFWSMDAVGYSLGIFARALPALGPSVYNMYLSICRNNIPSVSAETGSTSVAVLGSADTNKSSGGGVESYHIAKGIFAVVVWNANPGRPLKSVRANLTVSQDRTLELLDADGTIVWSVSNGRSMEMLDSGNLVIYDSADAIVYQSFEHPSDTLVKNQTLRVGMELVSGDFTYSMSMMPGGLRFSLRSASSGDLPYWQLPFNSNSDVSQAFCTKGAQDAYAVLEDSEQLGGFSVFRVHPGSCSNDSDAIQVLSTVTPITTFDLATLDGGWLKFVSLGSQTQLISDKELSSSTSSAYGTWGFCDLPLACGPYSICSKTTSNGHCSCPSTSFTAIPSQNGSYQGCELNDPPLPKCGSTAAPGQMQPTFQRLDSIASIFLLSGAIFHNKTSTLNNCMKSCRSSCSCTGFFYVHNISLCFPMAEGLTFVNVTASGIDTSPGYVAYLKLAGNITTKTSAGNNTHSAGSNTHSAAIKSQLVVVILVSSLLVAAGLIWLGVAARNWYTRRYVADNNVELLQILPSLTTRFSYRDLHTATQGFARLLGAGAFGSVYEGTLPDGREIAVKKLQLMALMEGSLSKQFIAEITAISQTGHVNIVNLLGFCWESSHRLLVYEYMDKGSLDKWLFHKGEGEKEEVQPLLGWATRFNIAIGVARGLTYLHEECSQPILHLDIKPQNILLDQHFEAKLADFGLSRLITAREMSQVVTTVRGTPGYMAPELLFLPSAAITKKCDVYSMGIVFLEIIGGRKTLDISLLMRQVAEDMHSTSPSPSGELAEEWHFPSWAARKCEEGNLLDLVDKRLEGAFQEDEARKLVLVAMWCLQENPTMRPAASTVTNWLQGTAPITVAPPFSNIAHAQSTLKASISQGLQASSSRFA